ncbi:MAG: hypothetical protein M1814_006897 [Vezdaea aestivalis]|nr:MAG: hypothetical protein M1814_006897 [Vezdaea aestivalis]
MSDLGRKDFSTKAKEGITPDSSKTTAEKLKETVTTGADRVAAQGPGESKSTTQQAADRATHSKDEAAHGGSGGSVLDKAKNAVGLK